MRIEQAIQKAISGGFGQDAKKKCGFDDFNIANNAVDYLHSTLLNPSFWQSLCSVIGEGAEEHKKIEGKHWCGVCARREKFWKDTWHRFIDHLAENKSIGDYFKDL